MVFGLFLFGGGLVHYGAMYLSWTRQKVFVERYIRQARRAAWGDDLGIKGIPGVDGVALGTSASPPSSSFAQENGQAVLNRRQKRMQEKEAKREKKGGRASKGSGISTPQESEPETTGPQGSRKKVQAENGKILIVDSVGNVFLEEVNKEGETGEYLLDPDEIPKPTYRDTVVFRLPAWTFNAVKGRLLRKSVNADESTAIEESNGGEDNGQKGTNSDNSKGKRGKKVRKRDSE